MSIRKTSEQSIRTNTHTFTNTRIHFHARMHHPSIHTCTSSLHDHNFILLDRHAFLFVLDSTDYAPPYSFSLHIYFARTRTLLSNDSVYVRLHRRTRLTRKETIGFSSIELTNALHVAQSNRLCQPTPLTCRLSPQRHQTSMNRMQVSSHRSSDTTTKPTTGEQTNK